MDAWAAMREKAGSRRRKEITICGDGEFGQFHMKFTTAVKYGMDFTHVHFDDGDLCKSSKEQRSGERPVWETDLQNPSFTTFARFFGGHGIKVTDASKLEETLAEASGRNGPAPAEIMTDAELV